MSFWSQLDSQLGISKAASVAVSSTAAFFGVPITPQQVNTVATGIKTNTYDKPANMVAPAPVAPPQVVGVVPQTDYTLPLLGAFAVGLFFLLRK